MNVNALMAAIASHTAADALRPRFTEEHWTKLAPFFRTVYLQAGRELIVQGDHDRDLYILVEGELSVVVAGKSVATLTPGTVVGEGAFFSGSARNATVVAATAGVAWALGYEKYEAMSNKHSRTTLEFTRSLASVLALRMRSSILVGEFM
jgi:CRP/FNR family transcriptional regulator, cyclic AMP receptor protein